MKKLIVFLVFFLAAPIVWATMIPDLYTARVTVNSHSAEERTQALQQAFKQIVVKLTGSDAVLNKPRIQAAANRADDYLQQYGYQKMQMPEGPSLVLKASFDPNAIQQLLASDEIPVWGKNRPSILVWLATKTLTNNDSAQGSSVINNEDDSVANKLLNYYAQVRGLPIILPMNDIQNLQSVSFGDLWQYRLDAIRKASERYGSDVILIATVEQMDAQRWFSHWLLLFQDNQNAWNFQGDSLDHVIEQGISQTTENLATRFAIAEDDKTQGQVRLVITGINNIDDYAKVQHYLQQLTPVKNVEIKSVGSNTMVFNLQIVGGIAALQQAINVEQLLQPINTGPSFSQNTDSQSFTLMYQWQS